jgi:hypothetical protein
LRFPCVSPITTRHSSDSSRCRSPPPPSPMHSRPALLVPSAAPHRPPQPPAGTVYRPARYSLVSSASTWLLRRRRFPHCTLRGGRKQAALPSFCCHFCSCGARLVCGVYAARVSTCRALSPAATTQPPPPYCSCRRGFAFPSHQSLARFLSLRAEVKGAQEVRGFPGTGLKK